MPCSLSNAAPSSRSPCTSGDSQQAIPSSISEPWPFGMRENSALNSWQDVGMSLCPACQPTRLGWHDEKEKEVDKSQHPFHTPGNGSFSLTAHFAALPTSTSPLGLLTAAMQAISKTVACTTCTMCTWYRKQTGVMEKPALI